MIYSHWMSYIKDEVKLRDIVIPGTHNAGSYGMPKIACCQDGNLKQQFDYGIRHYCLRLNTDKKGELVLCHGPLNGDKFVNAVRDLRDAMLESPGEFFILDLREYYPQKIGPFSFNYKADSAPVDEILQQYLEPEKYALIDFDDIGTVTMGDIRRSGKRFLLINYREEYKFSVNCPHILPWEKRRHGSRAFEFATRATDAFDENDTAGLYWFQTQQTPNFGTKVGVTYPRSLDKHLRWHFSAIINTIANTPKYLEKANIISGDFMTEDYFKVQEILKLNLNKNNVYDDKRKEFAERLREVDEKIEAE